MKKDFICIHRDSNNDILFITDIGDWRNGIPKFVSRYRLVYNACSKKIERRHGTCYNSIAEKLINKIFE